LESKKDIADEDFEYDDSIKLQKGPEKEAGFF